MSETGTGIDHEPRVVAREVALAADLKPSGALERMMIQQMARAHDTTMGCFDRAEAATEGAAREVELRLAARFMALFMQQAGTLDRRRAQARQAEEAMRREGFDEAAAQTRARVAHWEESLRRLEGAARSDVDDLNDPDDLDDFDDLNDPGGLEAMPDPAALSAMAERLGLPSPVDTDGNIDPDVLEAMSKQMADRLLGGAGAETAASGAGKRANGDV